MRKLTSSSAVAKRPRDASCPSVVSFNSTKRRVIFYCELRRLQICHCVQLNALFCCLWRNVEASCHKHFDVFSRNQHRRLRWWTLFNDMFISFDTIHERDGYADTQTHTHTDRHTDTAWRHRPRLCIASRSKKPPKNVEIITALAWSS